MHTPILLLNVGNTFTSWRVLKEEATAEEGYFKTSLLTGDSEEMSLLDRSELPPDLPVYAACTVPDAAQRLSASYKDKLHFINTAMVPEINFENVDTSTLGQDRIANAAAAVRLYETPVMIIDCGTAITTGVIDAQQRFLGGLITAGRRLQRDVLADRTGQLFHVSTDESYDSVIAHRTQEAIAGGIDIGLAGAITKYILSAQELFDERLSVVATGGDAAFFCERVKELQFIRADLTLYGLGIAAHNHLERRHRA